MAASDSFQLIIVVFITVLTVAVAIGSRVFRSTPTPLDELPPKIVHPAPARASSESQLLWNTLSNREEEIARLAADDWSDDAIARKLNLSVRTVQNHLQHAREKLHIHSRHEFKYFLQHLGDEAMAAPK